MVAKVEEIGKILNFSETIPFRILHEHLGLYIPMRPKFRPVKSSTPDKNDTLGPSIYIRLSSIVQVITDYIFTLNVDTSKHKIYFTSMKFPGSIVRRAAVKDCRYLSEEMLRINVSIKQLYRFPVGHKRSLMFKFSF